MKPNTGIARTSRRSSPVVVLVLALAISTGSYAFGYHRVAAENQQVRADPHGAGRVRAGNSGRRVVRAPSKTMTAGVISVRAALQTDNYCEGNPGDGKLLLISISLQHLWACDGTKIVNQSPVTTGTTVITNGVDDNTPVGTWRIRAKETDTPLTGCDANGCWDDLVRYWMPFDGEVGLHDASWQTFPFGASNYHTDGSHGCIQLPTALAAWIYNWAPVGTTVTIGALNPGT
jgi:hypothetical protein